MTSRSRSDSKREYSTSKRCAGLSPLLSKNIAYTKPWGQSTEKMPGLCVVVVGDAFSHRKWPYCRRLAPPTA